MRIRWKRLLGIITGSRQERLRDLRRHRLIRKLEKAEQLLLEQLKQTSDPQERREIHTYLLHVTTQLIHLY